MIHVRNAIARAASTAAIAVASFFDRSLDGLVSSFTRLDTKLEAFISRKDRLMDAEVEARAASVAREKRAATAEAGLRFQSQRREASHLEDMIRAERIRSKIADLIG